MSNKNIELVHTESDILSIRLSTNGFSFSIYNPERKDGTAFLSESSQAK